MADRDFHTRVIGWLKIVLPLIALALLSTLFLLSRRVDPEDAIPYARVDVEERLREPRVTAPTYAGVTEDGAALTIRAEEARPDPADPASGTARAVVGRLETPDGERTDLVADAAQIDGAGRAVTLIGGVVVSSPSGWTVTGERFTAAMDRTDLRSELPVRATGPAGEVTSNAMELTEAAGGKSAYLLVFKGDVKLVYRPAN